ncbi:MAG TPA: EscN/YscN/HrcN family type III secretion system ATPase, partial [Thiothrix sp.]|nr:EscN/YscN/HrcN family type III secretion system ATPase [Thiothrix sp.]
IVKAILPQVSVGEYCLLNNRYRQQTTPAEVIGFEKNIALIDPIGDLRGISSGTEVIASGELMRVGVDESLAGCVLDGIGNIIGENSDKNTVIHRYYPVMAEPPSPLSRPLVKHPLAMGIRTIDSLLTCGIGQRIGIFAGAGVGKSSLLSMLVKHASADINVIALIGERGREVREFIDESLGTEAMKKTVLIVATSDRPSIERLKAAHVATAVAEFFRDQGKNVLLLMDSLTRFARAQREIGLAAGEAPARRGFPPSVFAELPKLVERAGLSEQGSITAFYTVLIEGDDMSDPIADEVRSLLDGHIVLSRDLASKSHYPAIDVLASLSRVMPALVTPQHKAAAERLRELLAKYQEIEFLVQVGEYQAGSDPLGDEALAKINSINQFLKQRPNEAANVAATLNQLVQLVQPSS